MNKNFSNYTFNKVFKKITIFFELLLLFFLLFQKNFVFATDFKPVARVNDRIITQYDLDNYTKIMQLYFKNTSEINSKIKNEILNGLIEEVLKEQAVENEKIPFDEEEFNYFLQANMDKDNINKNVKKYGVDKDLYFKIVKNNFLWNKLIDTKIRSSINISNSEISDSLEYLTEKPLRTRYNISQIIIYKNNNSDPKAIVDKLYSEIVAKNNFESMAEKFSQDNKKNKGYVGWVDEMDINQNVYDAIKNLQIGSVSKPIYLGDQNSGFYMIIKLNDKKQEKIAKKDDIARVQYFIYNQKLNLEVKNYIDMLYNNAFIEIYK